MIKIMFGAGVVIALVGYGVITTQQIQSAGDTVRQGVNQALQAGADATADSTLKQLQRKVEDAVE